MLPVVHAHQFACQTRSNHDCHILQQRCKHCTCHAQCLVKYTLGCLMCCSKTLVAGASLYLDTDAKFGGPLHIEALPDQQQVLVLSCVVLCCAMLCCALLCCAVAVHAVHMKACSTRTATAEGSQTLIMHTSETSHVCGFEGRAVGIAGSCCSSNTTPLCFVRCHLPPLALSS